MIEAEMQVESKRVVWARTARYIRVANLHSPNNAKFSVSDFRVFGRSHVPLPSAVSRVNAECSASDQRGAMISWTPARGAEFYVVRVKSSDDTPRMSYQVYDGQTELRISSLNVNSPYTVDVDSINGAGISRGEQDAGIAVVYAHGDTAPANHGSAPAITAGARLFKSP